MRAVIAAFLFAWCAALPAFAQDPSAAAFDEAQAKQLRQEVASAREQAQTRLEQARRIRALEKSARDNARTSSAPRDRQDWEKRAAEHAANAARLEAEARRDLEGAAEKEKRAAGLEGSASTARKAIETRAAESKAAERSTPPTPSSVSGPGISRRGLLRVWRHVGEDWPFVIVQDEASRIEAHTATRVWHGSWRPPTPDDPRGERGPLAVFTYRPKAAEMNPDIPAWARRAVEGKLEWRIELADDGSCGTPRLAARWFRGQVTWREAGNGQAAQASVSGRGPEHRFELAASEDAAFDEFAAARLFLQLPGRTRAGPSAAIAPVDASPDEHDPLEFPVASLIKLQPFFVRVVLPPDLAEQQGPQLEVKVSGSRGGQATLTLEAGARRPMRSVVYTHVEPITLADGNDWLAEDRDPPFLSVNYLLGNRGSRLPLALANGEVVRFSFNDAVQAVPVYDSWVQAGIARHAEAAERVRAVLSAVLVQSRFDAAQKSRANRHLQMLKNLDAMLASPRLHDVMRYRVGKAYLDEASGLIGQPDEAAAAEAERLLAYQPLREDLRDGRNDPSGYYNGVVWTSNHERVVAERALLGGRAEMRDAALDEIPRAFAFGMYAAVANMSQVGGMYTTASGKDIFGKHVAPWERLMAGIGVAAGAVLQHGLPVVINNRLGPGSMGPSLKSSSWTTVRFSRPAAPVRVAQAKNAPASGATSALPKSLKPEHLRSLRGAAARGGKPGAVGCAIRGASAKPGAAAYPADAADLASYYGPNAKFIDAGPDPAHPPQTTGSCLCQAPARNVAAKTGLRLSESGVFRTLVENGIAKPRDFHDPEFTYTVEEVEGYLHLTGAKTVRFNGKIPLMTIDVMLGKGWHVTDVIAPRVGGKHAVDIVEVVKNPAKAYVAVRFYDPAFSRVVEVPSCDYLGMLDPDVGTPVIAYTWAAGKPAPASFSAPRPPPKPGATGIGAARPAKAPARPSAMPGGKTLHQMIDEYFRARGVEPPPLHVTNQDALQKVAFDGFLELHAGDGASWSVKGTLREGDVAIRIKPGHEKYVEFVKTSNLSGTVPRYWADGVVGRGQFKTYIPARHLEFFNPLLNEFRPIPGAR